MNTRRPNAGYVPRRAGQPGQDSYASSTLRVTPSGSPSASPTSTRSPISQRATPSRPSALPRRKPVSSAGSPGRLPPHSNVGIEDWHKKLEQMRREVAEIKAMEGQTKWKMKREEDEARKLERNQDASNLMNWRKEQANGLNEYTADRALADKINYQHDSREFQEFKRHVHDVDKANEMQLSKELYNETKDVSDWNMEMKRLLPLEEQRMMVDVHLERYALMAEYNAEELQHEKMDTKMCREMEEEAELGYQMLEVRKERDEALQSLEYFRAQQRIVAPTGRHIPSRPISTMNTHGESP